MLKTPQFQPPQGHAAIILSVVNALDRPLPVPNPTLPEGFQVIRGFSGGMMIWGRNSPEFYMEYPWLGDLNAYGVCDSPQQFIAKYTAQLSEDQRTFFVTFTHIAKEPENKEVGGGWRWHKWGPYIGEGTPEQEYLDDEDGFADGVYVYHIYQIDGPEVDPLKHKGLTCG